MINNAISERRQDSGIMRLKLLQTFNEEQKVLVASILSEYNPSSLTVDDIGSIINAFKDGGLEPGISLFEAIEEVEFEPAASQLIIPMILALSSKWNCLSSTAFERGTGQAFLLEVCQGKKCNNE